MRCPYLPYRPSSRVSKEHLTSDKPVYRLSLRLTPIPSISPAVSERSFYLVDAPVQFSPYWSGTVCSNIAIILSVEGDANPVGVMKHLRNCVVLVTLIHFLEKEHTPSGFWKQVYNTLDFVWYGMCGSGRYVGLVLWCVMVRERMCGTTLDPVIPLSGHHRAHPCSGLHSPLARHI